MIVRESISFQRGLDPKEALKVGKIIAIKSWFDSWGFDEKYYEIHDDFSVTYKYHMYLNGYKIDSFPDDMEILGSLSLEESQIGEFPKGLKIKNSLHLKGAFIESLPSDIKIGGSLYLNNSSIYHLPDGLKIKENLSLKDCNISSLPRGLNIGGYLDIRDSKITSLPPDLKVKKEIFKDF